MHFSPDNFLMMVKNLATGDDGIAVATPVPLSALDLPTVINYDGSEAGAATATLSGVYLAADETNARVVKVDQDIDTIAYLTVPIPRDYDEHSDVFKVRVMASQLTQSTDTAVQLDSSTYIKTAGVALGSDVSPTAPDVTLSTTEQWVEFDLSGKALVRGQVATFVLKTNSGNNTSGEEVLIHAFEVVHNSTVVSYDREDSDKNELR